MAGVKDFTSFHHEESQLYWKDRYAINDFLRHLFWSSEKKTGHASPMKIVFLSFLLGIEVEPSGVSQQLREITALLED